MPQVSVIVPNYNHAPYLRQRLDSIFNQTFQDFEVIILDDCSTDNSKEIIEEYRNRPQVSHVVYNETNSGSPFKQWAKGFDLAQGEYIWIAESDDWAELTFLENLVPLLIGDEMLSLVFCNSYNENGISPAKLQNPFDKTRIIFTEEMLKEYMCWGCAVYNASSVLFRRRIATNVDKDYQGYCSSGDYLFWIHLIEMGNVYYYHVPLNHYRIHGFNKSTIEHFSGKAFFEDLEIFRYKRDMGYLSFYMKNAIVLNYLNHLNQKIKHFPQNTILQSAKTSWEKEVFSIKISAIVVKTCELIWLLWKTPHKIINKCIIFFYDLI